MSTVRFKAKCDSYGFRGYYWEAGAETEVRPDEMDDTALVHFQRMDEIEPEILPRDIPRRGRPAPTRRAALPDDDEGEYGTVKPNRRATRKTRKPRTRKPRAEEPQATPGASTEEA